MSLFLAYFPIPVQNSKDCGRDGYKCIKIKNTSVSGKYTEHVVNGSRLAILKQWRMKRHISLFIVVHFYYIRKALYVTFTDSIISYYYCWLATSNLDLLFVAKYTVRSCFVSICDSRDFKYTVRSCFVSVCDSRDFNEID